MLKTKCHLFQEQSETFRTGSLCPGTTQETLSGDEEDRGADGDGDADGGDGEGGEGMKKY